MINMEFDVNKIIVLITRLRRMKYKEMPLLNQQKFSKLYNAINNFTNSPELYKEVIADNELMQEILKVIEGNENFEKYMAEAEENRETVKQRWDAMNPAVEDYFINTLGISTRKEFKVNIVNPNSCTGTNDLNNEIFWGHVDGKNDASYDITYIMHEAMHCLYPYQKEWNDEQKGICHSLIELAIDNELRCRLGGKIKDYGREGHIDGDAIRKRLMPLWKTFLSERGETFEKRETTDVEFRKYEERARKNGVQKMNYTELMQHAIEHYREYGIDHRTFERKESMEY